MYLEKQTSKLMKINNSIFSTKSKARSAVFHERTENKMDGPQTHFG